MKTTSKQETQLIDDIVSGTYRDYYLVYNRKSTDEPNNQKNSITYQKAENGKYAKRNGLPVAPITIKGLCVNGVISERHSGFKEDDELIITEGGLVQYKIERPKFQQVVRFLSKGCFKGIVFLCWDRASRNKGDNTIIEKLMRNGIDVRFTFAHYDKTSAGALHMDIDEMFAVHHSRVTSEKVKVATKNLRDRGVCTYRAPMGYLNLGNMDNKPFDPERAPIIKQIPELYATGEWSYADLARWANREGLTTPPMRRRRTEEELLAEEEDKVEIEPVSRPITVNHIYNILNNPFYTGKILNSNGVYIPSVSHKALISEELFNKVQSMQKRKKVSIRYTKKLDLPFRGFIRCGECGRVYTPYLKKGIHYYGARCAKGCSNRKKSINLTFIEEEVGKLISNLYLTDDELVEIDARVKTDIALLEERRHKDLEKNERRKKKIREDLRYLRTEKLALLKTGVYTPEAFMEEERRLNNKLAGLRNEEDTSDVAMHEVIKDVIKLSELLKDGYIYYSNANSEEKERIIRIVFSELSVSENTLQYICKNGFKALESRFVAVGDPTTWLSELIKYEGYITMSIGELSPFALGKRSKR